MIPYVSSKIVKFDIVQAIGCDGAGRHILLAGEPGAVSPQEFSVWRKEQEVSDVVDVTVEVVQLMATPGWRQK